MADAPRRPLIGVSRCSRLADYVASVELAGGDVRVLGHDDHPAAVLDAVDGILLTGGADVDPALYGEPRHPTVQDPEPGRDRFELDLAARALLADVPLLAICRGAQVLNVAAGGTLVQDIPSALGTAVPHAIEVPDRIAHAVAVVPGTRLAGTIREAIDAAGRCGVNSRHHQSVGRLGASLVATALAEDGVVEAIERTDAAFCVGVQWHPENFWRTGRFRGLFDALVHASAARRHARVGRVHSC